MKRILTSVAAGLFAALVSRGILSKIGLATLGLYVASGAFAGTAAERNNYED
jgi:hypothetical protein